MSLLTHTSVFSHMLTTTNKNKLLKITLLASRLIDIPQLIRLCHLIPDPQSTHDHT